ncbi:hypothetical protein A2U01_0017976, partial [Trifolium medium]|nr:hypothetical protein [Trifolium medium]
MSMSSPQRWTGNTGIECQKGTLRHTFKSGDLKVWELGTFGKA